MAVHSYLDSGRLLLLLLLLLRPRGRGTPSDSRTQRHGWAAGRSSASRVPLSSNATTTGHGLYKLEMVVIVDSRMLVLYFYFLINHIQVRSGSALSRLSNGSLTPI
jgi:hypothetical protein